MKNIFLSIKFLRLVTGIFFIVLGIYGILQNVNEGLFGLNNPVHRNNQTIEIVFGVIELVCGLLLFAGLFLFNSFDVIKISSIIVSIFWIIRIVFTKFIWGFAIVNSGLRFKPDIYTWILSLSVELVILACLFVLSSRYDN